MIYSVIGSSYGDEGKGLATDYLASKSSRALVIRHNGGAQAGHTVETAGLRDDHYDSKRFVFHELSSGSFRGADTYWASTYYPDLFKLVVEMSEFNEIAGFVPRIIASPDTNITIMDDIIINILLEMSRGDARHGSCGMGIWEATLRTEAGYGITISWIKEHSIDEIMKRLRDIRASYVLPRIEALELDMSTDPDMAEMLDTDEALVSFAHYIKENSQYVEIREETREFFLSYDDVIFEGGQGLSLDAENLENIPHVTASRTGLTNPLQILAQMGLELDEVVYVTRTYLTKHGAGPLSNEDLGLVFEYELDDETNIYNPWQGDIRYAKFNSVTELISRIKSDFMSCPHDVRASLFITHLNETGNCFLIKDGDMQVDEYISREDVKAIINKVYLSSSKYGKDVQEM